MAETRAISKRDKRVCSGTSRPYVIRQKMAKIDELGRRSDCEKKYSPFLPSALFPPVECRIQCPYSVPFIAMTRERFVAIKLILRAKRRWEHGKGTETDGEKEEGAGSKGWKRERG